MKNHILKFNDWLVEENQEEIKTYEYSEIQEIFKAKFGKGKENYFETAFVDEKIDWKKIFKGKSEEEKTAIAQNIIDKHPTKSKLFSDLKKKDPEKADKFLKFIMNKPYVQYFKWDKKKQEFTDTSKLNL